MTNPDDPGRAPAAAPATTQKLASPHDTLFYRIFSNPKLAAAELQNIFPKDVAAHVDWDSLHLDPNRFVDGNLGNHFADILLSARVRQKKTYIHVLFEHSSGPKTHELLQALRYQVRIWEKEKPADDDETGDRHLTPILTVILHHSETGWKGRLQFADYFGLDEELARVFGPYLVNFRVILDDISKVDTEALLSRPVPPEVQIVLFALRFGRAGRRVLDELPKITPTIGLLRTQVHGRLVIGLFFMYMKKVTKVPQTEIHMALQETLGMTDDELAAREMNDLWEKWERYQAAERQGELRGELKGQRKMLQHLLAQRFGPLPTSAAARIDAATLQELDAMSLRVLTAQTLDEVLGKPSAG